MSPVTSTTRPEPRNWKPIGVGAAATVALLAILIGVSVYRPKPTGQSAPGYASNIKFADLRVSAADTMMAGSVTYVEGTVENRGPRTITSMSISMSFYDPMGQLVQSEKSRIVGGKAVDLAPGRSIPFRVGFDHISAEWNQAPPNLRATDIFVK